MNVAKLQPLGPLLFRQSAALNASMPVFYFLYVLRGKIGAWIEPISVEPGSARREPRDKVLQRVWNLWWRIVGVGLSSRVIHGARGHLLRLSVAVGATKSFKPAARERLLGSLHVRRPQLFISMPY